MPDGASATALDSLPMDILVIGGGAREHALAWRLGRDESVRRVRIAPGNGGTAAVAERDNFLTVLVWMAPREHYYGRDVAAVNSMLDGVRFN